MAELLNTVYLGKDNPVVLNLSFTEEFEAGGLSNFTDIQVTIGGELYTLLDNPASVVVESDTKLRILIGTVTSLTEGSYSIEIIGVSATYDDGYNLTGCGKLGRIKVRN